MLVDTGWPDLEAATRTALSAAARLAGVKQIDYLVVTHYHMDHVGGVPQLAARIPIRTFVDHGPSVETGAEADQLFSAYMSVRDKGKHLLAKPGDVIPIRGIKVQVLTAAGNRDLKAVAGSGCAQPAMCRSEAKGPRPFRKCPVGWDAHYLWQVPHD